MFFIFPRHLTPLRNNKNKTKTTGCIECGAKCKVEEGISHTKTGERVKKVMHVTYNVLHPYYILRCSFISIKFARRGCDRNRLNTYSLHHHRQQQQEQHVVRVIHVTFAITVEWAMQGNSIAMASLCEFSLAIRVSASLDLLRNFGVRFLFMHSIDSL